MKLIMTTAAAALISTAALADTSTYRSDLFLDTSIGAEKTFGDETRMLAPLESTKANDITFNTADSSFDADTVMSTRSAERSPGEGYIYGGYGPGNDSR
ncbi:MAG: hypothetical protein CL583_17730 [Alteromonadaceae bacterium]|nr:hypothetical protein [Alteromonadaceae bacterium]|tara:strand:+ start:1510 stop:1806 length:297 start_codon:yes stop_codon:yes gene_type:complete